jgi:hypothetical protein
MIFNLSHRNWDNRGVHKISDYMSALKDWDYIVEIKKKTRSLEQNSLYRSIIEQIADYTWNEKDYLHSFFKSRYLKEEVIWSLWFHEHIPSTSDLPIDKFSAYIEKILNFCWENW